MRRLGLMKYCISFNFERINETEKTKYNLDVIGAIIGEIGTEKRINEFSKKNIRTNSAI